MSGRHAVSEPDHPVWDVLLMTDYRMPDSFYDPPDEKEPCEYCNDEGCISCDAGLMGDYLADLQMQRKKEEGW